MEQRKVVQEDLFERRRYMMPQVSHEIVFEVKAGSPLGVPNLVELGSNELPAD